MTRPFAAAPPRFPALLVALLAACDTEPRPAPTVPDAGVTEAEPPRDAQAVIDYFPTKPLCTTEVGYPPVSGDGICSVQVPTPDASALDFAKLNLILRVGGARIAIFDHVADPAACGRLQAWYYDDASSPSALVLCEEACFLAGSDPDSQVELVSGCDTRCAQGDTRCAPSAP